MYSKNKRKKNAYKIIGLTAAAFTVAAAILPGITYRYNYDRYVETNSEQVVEIGNNPHYDASKPIVTSDDLVASMRASARVDDPTAPGGDPTAPGGGTPAPDPAPGTPGTGGGAKPMLPQLSPDGSYYNIHNRSTLNTPRPNDSIDYGPTYKLGESKNFPYGSFFAASPYTKTQVTLTQNGPGVNFFGIRSNMYYMATARVVQQDGSSTQDPVYRYPIGFVSYPDVPTDGSPVEINTDTKYKLMYKSKSYDTFSRGTSGKEDWFNRGGGIFKTQLSYWPSDYHKYYEIYDHNTDANFSTGNGNNSFTGGMAFDIKGNKLSEIGINTGVYENDNTKPRGWEYFDQTVAADGKLHFRFTFFPKQFYFIDYTQPADDKGNRKPQILDAKGPSDFYAFQKDYNFVNYIPDGTNDNDGDFVADNTTANNIHAISMTMATSYRNWGAEVDSDTYQLAFPAIDYYSPTSESYAKNFKNPNSVLNAAGVNQNALSLMNVGNYNDDIPKDSKGTENIKTVGPYYGQKNVSSVTMCLTPVEYTNKAGKTMFLYVPLMYSGSTRINLNAVVEPNDKAFTPLDYVKKGLYAVGTDNGKDGPDADADFRVQFKANGYPGCEFGATNKLYLNNVAGQIRWEYNPGSVLKNGLIRKATEADTQKLTIYGFKRIPGVTKIADKVDTQSPFTLAQTVASNEPKLYKLIYDLAITNLPDVETNTDIIDWDPNNIDQLKQIMRVSNVTYSNIGVKTSTGYPEGGYITADVELLLYYNKDTNLVTPNDGVPSPKKTITLCGFQHVEPTRIPQEDIYHGDPRMTASQAIAPGNFESLNQYIIEGMQTPVKPTFENDFRTSKGGTLPVNDDFPDYTKIIAFIGTPVANNLDGTVSLNVILQAYYAENGNYMTSDFPAVPIKITGFKKVQQTKLNPTVKITSDRTASEALSSSSTGDDGSLQYPYLQYLLTKYKNDAFTGLPEGFNAGVIHLDQPIANNLEGTITVNVSVSMYYDQTGNLVDLTKNLPENTGKGPRPLGTIVMSGFKKVAATDIKQSTISVLGDIEFYNTLATQVDDTKIAALIFQNKDKVLTSYPGLRFSINSIHILKVEADNLSGVLGVEFALSRYYNDKGEYVEVDDNPDAWLKFTGNKKITISGFTSVVPTTWETTTFDASFTPKLMGGNQISAQTSSTATSDQFKEFIDGKNSTTQKIFGGSANPDYQVQKNKTGPSSKPKYSISLVGAERSAWEILQLGTKTIFQVTPQDFANYVLRVLQYAGMQNYGINIKLSDISVTFTTPRDPSGIINTSNIASYEDQAWYTGTLGVQIAIQLKDGLWTKNLNFKGTKEKSMNVFSRYIPLPVYTTGNTSGEKNLSAAFTAGDIEHFLYQNIYEVVNGMNANGKSGVPVNFSNFNISISNVFYNNNNGTVSVKLTIDNFYLPSGNLSTNPSKAEAATAPKVMSETIVFKGFKQQHATTFKPEVDLGKSNAQLPFPIPIDPTQPDKGTYQAWGQMTADQFWNGLQADTPDGLAYAGDGKAQTQFVYDLIMGNGKVLPEVSGGKPNPNRILADGAEIPASFGAKDVIGADATWSNVDGRLDVTFKIVNYYDLYGNLELNAPKTAKVSIYGFKTTQASILAGTKFTSEDILSHKIVINGTYNTTASLVTPDYIINNVLNQTSGAWPGIDGQEDVNQIDFVKYIKPGSISIVSANNSTGKVTLNFFLQDDVQIYDEQGNRQTLQAGVYTLEVNGFETSLMMWIGIAVVIVFVLFVLLPTISIIIKKSRVKTAARGSFKDFK